MNDIRERRAPATPVAAGSRDAQKIAPWWRRFIGHFSARRRGGPEAWAAALDWSDDASQAICRMYALAGDEVPTWEHILEAAAGSAELKRYFELAGVEPERLMAVSKEIEPKRDSLDELRRLLAATILRVRGAGKPKASFGDLLLTIEAVDSALANRLAAAGLGRTGLTTFLAHGVVRYEPITEANAPPGDELDVVVHNDDYTTHELVVAILEGVFEMDAPRAYRVMLEVHRDGIGVVATLPRRRAIEKANEARMVAKNAGYPLLVTVENLVG